MSDELERLQSALRVTTPRPSAAARERAVAAATATFERQRQGIREAARQKEQVSDNNPFWLASWLRRVTVPTSPPALALAGAAFLIVIGVVLRQLLLTPIEWSDPAGLPASLPSPESTSQLQVEPALPPADLSPPPEMERIREAEVAEVMERIAAVSSTYSLVRASLQRGVLPRQDAVRVEELVNFFPYDYAPPESREAPLAVHVFLMPAPWNAANRLLHVGIKGDAAASPAARDVKVRVEFNPALVRAYRLIGDEARTPGREDFLADEVDAGSLDAGHAVTAIYELTPVGSGAGLQNEVARLSIRYQLPDGGTSADIVRAASRADGFESVNDAPLDVRFAAAVAAFGQLLRGGRYTGDFNYDDVMALAQNARGEDPFGYRGEFVNLVRLAQAAAAAAAR